MAQLAAADARLILLGEGRLRGALAARARRLGIEQRVAMPGYVDDIRAALDRARLCVISSDYEGYPAVAIEALAAGVPVVATDCSPAIHEILGDPRLGMIVPAGDAAALAVAIDARLASVPANRRPRHGGDRPPHRAGRRRLPRPVRPAGAMSEAGSAVRRIFANLGLLAGGKAAAGLVGIAYVVIVARTLGRVIMAC